MRRNLKDVKSARMLVAAELKWKCAIRRRDLCERGLDGESVPVNAIPLVKTCIEILATADARAKLEKKIKNEFQEIFEPIPHASQLPMTETAKIELKKAEHVIKMRSYSCAPKFNDAFRTLIQERLDSGFIRPSNSQFLSPSFVIPQNLTPKAKMRWVCDYRGLNDNVIPDNFPLPNIDEILRDCAKGKIWGKN